MPEVLQFEIAMEIRHKCQASLRLLFGNSVLLRPEFLEPGKMGIVQIHSLFESVDILE